MKILSRKDCVECTKAIERAMECLEYCKKKMKGRYGTKDAVSHLECALTFINDCITDNKYRREFYQQFRNPPNTPKSRRLGWHKEGVNDEQ